MDFGGEEFKLVEKVGEQVQVQEAAAATATAEETERDNQKEGPTGLNKLGSSSTAELHPKATGVANSGVGKHMPPASVITRLILIMVWRKLIRNPNTYSSLIGVIWSLVAFR